jgi:hypothetical protein
MRTAVVRSWKPEGYIELQCSETFLATVRRQASGCYYFQCFRRICLMVVVSYIPEKFILFYVATSPRLSAEAERRLISTLTPPIRSFIQKPFDHFQHPLMMASLPVYPSA